MSLKSAAVVALVSAGVLSGCTRSLEVKYAPGFDQNAAVRAQSKQKIAIVPFVDGRAWVDAADAQTQSFVAKQGAWKFGLTYGDQEFVPVSTVVQRLFVDEFTAAGYEAVAAEQPATDAFTLSGKIVTFEFENETGFVTVTSRRSVTLALTLTDRKGAKLVDELLFSENDRENEGMGVMHSTNMDKLFNRVFKKVVGDVLTKLQPRLAGSAVRVSLNGVPVAEMNVPLVAAN
jgi:hypothetical protein